MSHARRSPSSASRWSTCTASTDLIETLLREGKIKKDESSVYAEEGTLAHAHAETGLLMGHDPENIEDPEMALHVGRFIDYVENYVTGLNQLKVEYKVPLFYSTKERGTIDALIDTGNHIHIIDLKYGAGVEVQVFENKQLMIYAESAIQELEKLGRTVSMDQLVTLHIYQPRIREGEKEKRWTLSRRELQDNMDLVEASIRKAEAGITEFMPSESACRWCEAKALCVARATWASGGLPRPAALQLDLPASDTLAEDDIARIAKIALGGQFSKWLDDVKMLALDRWLGGSLQDMGLKAVLSTKHKRWLDVDAAAKLLKRKLPTAEVLPPSIVTPSQAEAMLKGMELSTKFRNKLDALFERPEGAPTLVLDTDKRQAIPTATAASEFGDVEDLM
jgi:hypothetical protein